MQGESAHPDGALHELFVARVTKALGRSRIQRPVAPPPMIDDSVVRQVGVDADLLASFEKRASELGLHVKSCVRSEVGGEVVRTLRQCSAARVILAFEENESIAPIRAELTACGIEVNPPQGDGTGAMFDADAGITVAVAGVADCGAIACRTSRVEARLASVAPPIHVALLNATAIVPDMIDLFRAASEHGWSGCSSAITLIAGPSKTADIEGVLITGVHGPREVHVMLILDR